MINLARLKERVVIAIKCWWAHDWSHVGGRWIIQGQASVTEQQCKRCGLYYEIEHLHPFGMRILSKKEYRPLAKKLESVG